MTNDGIIRKIYTDGNTIQHSSEESFNKIKVVNVANVNNNWDRNEGDAASAGFYRPGSLDFDSNGDLYIADHEYLKKLTVGTQSGNPQVTNIIQKGWSDKRGLVVDGSNNVYFSGRDSDYIYKYNSSTGSLLSVVDNGSGSVDGDLSVAQIARPTDLALHLNG